MPLRNVASPKPLAPYVLPNKRVVLIHRDGMESIAGEFVAGEHELHAFIEVAARGTRKRPFGLIRVTPRAYYYREITEPITKANTFDPRQV